jgi:predicted AlkP superfamily pyrophosphatase or phosphodiesterase
MFAIGVPHVQTFMYGSEEEDFKAGTKTLLTAKSPLIFVKMPRALTPGSSSELESSLKMRMNQSMSAYSLSLSLSLSHTHTSWHRKTNETLNAELRKDRISLFLHLLGTDTIGHAAKPQSSRYLASIRLVDSEIGKLVELIEEFYGNDQRTACKET